MAHNTSIHTQIAFKNMTELLVPILSHMLQIERKKKLLRPKLISKEKSNMNSECLKTSFIQRNPYNKKIDGASSIWKLLNKNNYRARWLGG